MTVVRCETVKLLRSPMDCWWCETVKLLRSHGGSEDAAISVGLVLDLNNTSKKKNKAQ